MSLFPSTFLRDDRSQNCWLILQERAIRILCYRYLCNPANVKSLDADSTSPDPATKQRAQLLYNLLNRYAPDHGALEILNRSTQYLNTTTSGPFANQTRNILDGLVPTTQPRPREREESIEEQQLRRRRREAVVVNEGDHPLSQGDIIQRSSGNVVRQRDEAETRRVERALEEIATNGTVFGSGAAEGDLH
jgi:hypothetical protein